MDIVPETLPDFAVDNVKLAEAPPLFPTTFAVLSRIDFAFAAFWAQTPIADSVANMMLKMMFLIVFVFFCGFSDGFYSPLFSLLLQNCCQLCFVGNQDFTRFGPMSCPYDAGLLKLVHESAGPIVAY